MEGKSGVGCKKGGRPVLLLLSSMTDWDWKSCEDENGEEGLERRREEGLAPLLTCHC